MSKLGILFEYCYHALLKTLLNTLIIVYDIDISQPNFSFDFTQRLHQCRILFVL